MNFDFDKTIASQSDSKGSKQELPYERLGVYRLISHLGDGGMGRVYLAEHMEMQRKCALKLLPKDLSKRRDFVERFKTEAKVLASLDHPNIVRVHNFGQSQGEFFLEMEFVEGGDLQDYIRRTQPEERADQCRDTLLQIMRALQYAHGKNVIHRDLKPGNVLLKADGTVKISDFGLATVVGEEYHKSLIEKSITLSQMGDMPTLPQGSASPGSSIAGTILYMSPQALRGEPATSQDDLYAVGVMTYYLATGKTPNVNFRPASRFNPKLNKRWDKFIYKSLEEDPKARFATALAAIKYLDLVDRSRLVPTLILTALAITLAGTITFHYRGYEMPYVSNFIEQAEELVLGSFEASGPPERGSSAVEEVQLKKVDASIGTIPPSAKVYIDGALAGSTPLEVEIVFEKRASEQNWQAKELLFEAEGYESLTVRVTPSLFERGPLTIPLKPLVEPGLANQPNGVDDRVAGDNPLQVTPADGSKSPFDEEFFTISLPDGEGISFRQVAEGEFNMGTPPEGKYRSANESYSKVEIKKRFGMGITEVTQAQYRALMNANPSNHRFNAEHHPVEQVVWSELVGPGGFLEKLNAYFAEQGITEIRAVLPTEIQWEYACRAGTETDLNDGSSLTSGGRDPQLDNLAVYLASKTAPVASKAPNAWGLFDMHGNIGEWTREGILRGGSYSDSARYNRAASRKHGQQNARPSAGNGFRVALEYVE